MGELLELGVHEASGGCLERDGLLGDPAGLPHRQPPRHHLAPEPGEAVAKLHGLGDVVTSALLRHRQGDGEVGDRELADHERPLTQEPQDAFGAQLAGLVGQPCGGLGVGLEVLEHLQRVTGDRPLLGVGDPELVGPVSNSSELDDLGAARRGAGLGDRRQSRLCLQPQHVNPVTSRCCGSDPRGLRDARGLASGAAGGGGCHGTEPTDRHRQFCALRAWILNYC